MSKIIVKDAIKKSSVITGINKNQSSKIITSKINKSSVTGITQPEKTNVLTIGMVGPQGAPGSTSTIGLDIVAVANITISGHRLIVIDELENLHYADNLTTEHEYSIRGISINSASVGGLVNIKTLGEIELGTWNWNVNEPIFCGENGLLTQNPNHAGFIKQVAEPITATKIWIDLKTTII